MTRLQHFTVRGETWLPFGTSQIPAALWLIFVIPLATEPPRGSHPARRDNAVIDHISWRVLLVLAVLGQSRVLLWRRVILFDHEFDRHAVKLLENESPIDHRVHH